jgi:UDP-2,4-diacetamido-2,4,6-trideoxy-beta-L-altropyranose hydrolase
MRCIALTQAAISQKMAVIMVCRVNVQWVRERLARESIPHVLLTDMVPQQENADDILARLSSIGITHGDWVVIDGYHFGLACQKAVRSAGYKLLVIDDYAHLPEYSCDVLLNQNIGAEELVYKGDIGRKLLGPEYALLRPEFLAARNRAEERPFPENAQNILLTLGGGDFSKHLARIAPDFSIPELAGRTLRVIAGAIPPERIRALLRDCSANVEILDQVDDMPALLLDTDLCVTAGGSTCWELCCAGTPFMVLELAENQRHVADSLIEQGLAFPFSAKFFRNLMSSAVARLELGRKGQTLVTGKGAYLALDNIKTLFTGVALRPASLADSRRVWQLANDPGVRSISCVSRSIAWEEHQAWYNARLRCSLPFWVAESTDGEFYGYVRFTADDEGRVAVSIALTEAQRGKGKGADLLQRACKLFLESFPSARLDALILESNTSSQRIFQKTGFLQTDEARIDGRRFLRFSRQNPLGRDDNHDTR